MNCENCSNQVVEKFGSGRFCSRKCSKAFSTKAKRSTINEKVSSSLKRNFGHEIECKCGKKVIAYKETARFCSRSCASRYHDFEKRSIAASQAQRRVVSEGRHNGFPSRKSKVPSWAEQFAIRFFDTRSVKYEREFKINRFFADFAFLDKKVVLEIDGKQHLDRVEHDVARDHLISKDGWKVVRIPWIHRDSKKMLSMLENFITTEIL